MLGLVLDSSSAKTKLDQVCTNYGESVLHLVFACESAVETENLVAAIVKYIPADSDLLFLPNTQDVKPLQGWIEKWLLDWDAVDSVRKERSLFTLLKHFARRIKSSDLEEEVRQIIGRLCGNDQDRAAAYMVKFDKTLQ